MDNIPRTLDILRLIPKYPDSISTTEIWEELKHTYLHKDLLQRTVQRDLEKIFKSQLLPLDCSVNTRPLKWFWKQGATRLQFPSMSIDEAISFVLVKSFLDKLLPPIVQDRISDIFELAHETLKKSDFAFWVDKVRIVPSNLELVSPEVNQEILNTIYDALLKNLCIKVTYKPLEDEQLNNVIINPLAIVMRHNIGYLVATSEENTKPKQFALHRFKKVTIYERDSQNKEKFNLEKYIADGYFEYPIKNAPSEINIKLVIKDYMKLILTETPLCHNQIITDYADNFYLLTARVKNTRQLRWWIYSFAPGIVILEPIELRNEFIHILDELRDLHDRFSL